MIENPTSPSSETEMFDATRTGAFGSVLASFRGESSGPFTLLIADPMAGVGHARAGIVHLTTSKRHLTPILEGGDGDVFGIGLACLKDLDRDGSEDVGVFSCSRVTGALSFSAVTTDGRLIWTRGTDKPIESRMAWRPIAMPTPDIDDDGVPDVAMLWGGQCGRDWRNELQVLSGRSGRVLWQVAEALPSGKAVSMVISSGWVASRCCILVGVVNPAQTVSGQRGTDSGLSMATPGVVCAFTLDNGQLAGILEGRTCGGNWSFGWSLDIVGDLNADGHGELLVAQRGQPGENGVWAVSTLSGVPVKAWRQRWPYSTSVKIIAVGDCDSDDVEDLAVAAPNAFAGSITVLSGATDAVLGTLIGSEFDIDFGADVALAGDWDGDGVVDIAIGIASIDGWQAGRGSVDIRSMRTWKSISSFE